MGNEKLKKSLAAMATVTVVGLSSVFFSAPASAETLDELKNKQTQIQEEREGLKANLSNAEAEIADLLIDLEKLNQEIEKVNKALDENKATMKKNEAQITDTETEVDKLQKEINELEAAIEKRFEILKERAVAYQKNGGNLSYFEVLFGSQSFMDFISRVSAINKITESDASLIEQIDEDKVKVEEKQDEVLAKLDELKEMKVELEGMQALIKDQQTQNKAKKAELKDKEANIVARVNELEMKDSELASLEREVRQNIDGLTQPAADMQVASTTTAGSADKDELTTLSKSQSKESTESKKSTESKESTSRPAASGGIQTAINAGFGHLGTPYVWGGKGPSGFDCSGFVSWAFAQGGISIPSSTSALAGTGTKVSASDMQPGDIVFFNTYKTNGHVGIYLGGGKFIGAQNSTGLAVADMTSGYWADTFAGHVRSVR